MGKRGKQRARACALARTNSRSVLLDSFPPLELDYIWEKIIRRNCWEGRAARGSDATRLPLTSPDMFESHQQLSNFECVTGGQRDSAGQSGQRDRSFEAEISFLVRDLEERNSSASRRNT